MRREGERGGEHVWGYCETFLEGEEKEGGVSFGVGTFFLKEEGREGRGISYLAGYTVGLDVADDPVEKGSEDGGLGIGSVWVGHDEGVFGGCGV